MTADQQPGARGGALYSLNMAIDTLNLAKEATGLTPAKAAFESARDLLTTIRNLVINKANYVALGLTCADVCEALNQWIDRRRADQFSQSALQTIERLTMTVGEIQEHIIKRSKRNPLSRRFHAKDDKEAIATWRLNLGKILRGFNTEPINTRVTVSGIHQDATNTCTTVPRVVRHSVSIAETAPYIRGDVSNTHSVVSEVVIGLENTPAMAYDVHPDMSNAQTIVPEVRRDISNTHPIVPGARSDTTNSFTVVSDIHLNDLENREDVGGKSRVTHARAPGESPPPQPRNIQGTASDIRREVVLEVQTMVSDIRHMLKSQEIADSQDLSRENSVLGEPPPPPPRVFFGRDELIEKIAGFVESLTPIALIGTGGIGKTSTILTVLHDDRIKQRFGDNRWFIRCDQFPASRAHLLRRLSKATGAGIENPEELAPLRRYLSSREMLIVLDNAESILGLQGTNGQEIYTIVDELSRFSNICLCITSRITTVPPECETIDMPTLSMGAAYDTFHLIYKLGEQSDLTNNILKQLDFHPLSITLLATVAKHNRWDTDRLVREWERQRTGILRIQNFGSLAATIELSLASPTFRELGPDARELLGVIAFFPRGVHEKNISWLFPTISNGPNMFDKFCILSLTYRSDGFITMLAPLRDYLRPKDPIASPLLSMTKERYFTRLLAHVYPERPGFKEALWIMSEDVNVENLIDVFTSADVDSKSVWDACVKFMDHLYWHKPRLVVLGPKIEALPDNHPSKAECLQGLSRLFESVGNRTKRKQLLTHTLALQREHGDDHQVALTLGFLSDANRRVGLYEEGIRQAREASEIYERLGKGVGQAQCLINLAFLMHDDGQLDAAEEAASRAMDLLPEKGEQFLVCRGHRILGKICHPKGEREKAIHHFEAAHEIASSLDLNDELFWNHFSVALLFSGEGKFDEAHAHIERARSHATNDAYNLARASQMQARFWDEQRKFGEAKSEALCALDGFEKLGAARDAENTRGLLEQIDRDARGDGRSGDAW